MATSSCVDKAGSSLSCRAFICQRRREVMTHLRKVRPLPPSIRRARSLPLLRASLAHPLAPAAESINCADGACLRRLVAQQPRGREARLALTPGAPRQGHCLGDGKKA